MPRIPNLPLSLNPVMVLDVGKDPVQQIQDVMGLIHQTFPDIPVQRPEWALDHARADTPKLVVRLDQEVTLRFNFLQTCTIAVMCVPSSLDRKTKGDSHLWAQQMHLKNDVPSDFQGWLFVIKSLYDELYQPCKRFVVVRRRVIRDNRKGQDVELRVGEHIEVHPTIKAIRRVKDPRQPTHFHDWSWIHSDNVCRHINDCLRMLPLVAVKKYRVEKRFGFLAMNIKTIRRFVPGTIVEVRTDGTAIRVANDTEPVYLTHESWTPLDPEMSTGTVAEALKQGALVPENGELL